jgi:hypothetical protein
MLSLTDHQLATLLTAAAMVPVNDRGPFLQSVAAQIKTFPPSDPELATAITWVLQARNVSVSPELFLPRRRERALAN